MTVLTIGALARAFKSGEATPAEMLMSCLGTIDAHEEKTGAFQLLLTEEARAAAEAATKAIQAEHRIGPFHGIPFALKDLVDVEGHVTTGGSTVNAENVATGTATIAKRLIAGGGILVGKTKTVEFAYGPWGTNTQLGTPWNPWDQETKRAPGGSSSGSGASVAAGMAVCAVGTDTGGSVRIPSAFCGLTGLKVTEGRLPLDGIVPLSHTLDTPGPMCRSVEDAALMYLTMLGEEPGAIDKDLENDTGLFGRMQRGLENTTVAVFTAKDREILHPEVDEHYQAAIDRLASLGAEIVELELPRSVDDMRFGVATLIGTEGYYYHGHHYENPANAMDEDVKARIMEGKTASATDYIRAQRERLEDKAKFLAAMKGMAALVTPTTPIPAPVVAEIDQTSAPSHFTRMANYLGFCALSLPMGLTGDGLPTSLQITARPRHEGTALRIGAAFEKDFGGIGWPEL